DSVLPARLGGSALDYQLSEEEDETGLTRLFLYISPRIQIADENAVTDLVLRSLSESSAMGDAARALWQQARSLRIKRAEPVWTERGKLLPLRVQGRRPRA